MRFPTEQSKQSLAQAMGLIRQLELTAGEQALNRPHVFGTDDVDVIVQLVQIHIGIIRGEFAVAAGHALRLYEQVVEAPEAVDADLIRDVRGTLTKLVCELAGPDSANVIAAEGRTSWRPEDRPAWGAPGPGFYADGACLGALDDLHCPTAFEVAWKNGRIPGACGDPAFARMLFDAGRQECCEDQNAELHRRWFRSLEFRVGEALCAGLTDDQLDEFGALADSDDDGGAQRFLLLNVPRYPIVVRQANLALALELRTGRPVQGLPCL
ncbi:DUF5663 domain-containing protein [Granulicoccus sp. GXG6511]|uniref:DUF5663 domain-containing protein n=1 Tax=Granulicoccus sp. GXG6511 TaxID=3381351 RepID=UPI003D7D685F